MMEKKLILPNSILLGEVNELLGEGKSVILMTKGSSMLPFIRGDKDSVELVRRDSVEVGDIALVRLSNGAYVLHRVVGVSGKITLKGDGNLDNTESCPPESVCGVAVRILRPDGRSLDCTSASFRRWSRRWRESPRFVRRYCLAVYRRLRKLI